MLVPVKNMLRIFPRVQISDVDLLCSTIYNKLQLFIFNTDLVYFTVRASENCYVVDYKEK